MSSWKMWTVLAQSGCIKIERGALARRMSSPRGVTSLSGGEFNMVVNAQLSSCSDKSGGEYAAGEQARIVLCLDVNGGKILRLCIV